jgi:hypothetical protein
MIGQPAPPRRRCEFHGRNKGNKTPAGRNRFDALGRHTSIRQMNARTIRQVMATRGQDATATAAAQYEPRTDTSPSTKDQSLFQTWRQG